MNYRKYTCNLSAVIIFLSLFSCKKEDAMRISKNVGVDTPKISSTYSILLNDYRSKRSADSLLLLQKSKFHDTLFVRKLNTNKYGVVIGQFPTNYSAGKHAYELFEDSLITAYKIIKNDSIVFDLYSNIPFSAYSENEKRPSVYNYNLVSGKYEMIWSRWGRKVINLNNSKELENCFITTALGMGWRGGFPYILDARVYMYNRLTNNIREIFFLGNGLQLYTYWETPDTFKVNFTILDSMQTSILIQKIIAFDDRGKKLYETERSFSLLTDGFPLPPPLIPLLTSPNHRYKLKHERANFKNNYFLYDIQTHLEYEITKSPNILFDVFWSEDSNYLFVLLQGRQRQNLRSSIRRASEFYIYNAGKKQMEKVFKGSRYKNYLINGNLILFDQRNDKEAKIIIYNFVKDKFIGEIKVPGGCGLNNIPFQSKR